MACFQEYIEKLKRVIDEIEITEGDKRLTYEDGMERLMEIMQSARSHHRQLFFAGNGGSAAIAEHMTADYLKNGHMRTVSLYDSPVVTCLGNDYGYEYVFSKQLEMMAEEGDLFVPISSSGNSQNIINAIEVIRKLKGTVISFTGFKPDNRARMMGDINVYVPCNEYGIVESTHNLVLQQLVDELMALEKSDDRR